MIVTASDKCLVPWLVPNVNNPREQVETVNSGHVSSSCSLLPPSAASCFLQPFEIFSYLSCSQADIHKSMVKLKTVLLKYSGFAPEMRAERVRAAGIYKSFRTHE